MGIVDQLWQDITALLVLGTFAMLIYMKLSKKTFQQVMQDLKGLNNE